MSRFPTREAEIKEPAQNIVTGLTGQDRTKDHEYRIVASNKAGDGHPSNTAARMES